MKAFPKYVETLQRDRAMPKDTGELIFKKSINLCCQPIFIISRVLLLRQMPPFPRACHILDTLASPFGHERYLSEGGWW